MICYVPLPTRRHSGRYLLFYCGHLSQRSDPLQSRHPFTIDAWVLLPDHLHCIWALPPGDADYHRVDWMTASKTKHRESTFWQQRYWEHCITTDLDYAHHRDYIAINPVKHGLVNRVCAWPYSTFHRDVARGIYPLDWAGGADILDLQLSGQPIAG